MVRTWQNALLAAVLLPMSSCREDAPLGLPAPAPSFGVAPDPGVVAVPAVQYSAGAGSFVMRIAVKEGLVRAAARNHLAIGVDVSLKITTSDGRVRAVAPDCFPLADQKVLGVSPDPYIVLDLNVPWDQRDDDGALMTGAAVVDYSVRLVFHPAGVERQLGRSVSGAAPLELPAVQ
jgi:hypothetical protein